MNIENLREIALGLKGVTEDIKWGHHLCFNIGEKMFLLTSPDEIPCNVTFKVTSEKFEELLSKEGFSKDVYLGRYHWIHIDDIGRLNKTEWEELVSTSYGLVLEKIGGRKRKELGV